LKVIYIDEFTYKPEDFDTPAPYEYVTSIKDPFQQQQAENKLAKYAASIGVKAFKRTLNKYRESLKKSLDVVGGENVTDFDEPLLELRTGEWTADSSGVYRHGLSGIEYACPHPIYITKRLRNIDTGEVKIELAFSRGNTGRKAWSTLTVGYDTIANAKNIVNLANIGISVTSGRRAQALVDYLADIMDLNYDSIPECRSVSRLGWNEEGFSPYVDGIVFDGSDSFGRVFKAIKPHGDFETWKAEAISCRQYNIAARLVLAAAFASVLIKPIGCLPFFVHLWGMDSGTGKTVAQMLAASVWADPFVGGEYLRNFRATSVGFEVIAGFLNSLPVIIDELQLARDARGKINFNVYELASGSGKLRSNKTLGLASTPTWACCFITSGETPLVSENDGSGAINRVIEIECKAAQKVILDGHKTAGILRANYGHAGKLFIEKLLKGENLNKVHDVYNDYYEACMTNNTTEKQAMAAALLLTGDLFATSVIFKDGDPLSVDAIAEFLKSREDVSAADRGYHHMCDWVAQNVNKFKPNKDSQEVYGMLGEGADDGWVYINRAIAWDRACADAGLSPKALLSHLKSLGLIQTRGKGFTKTKRICGVPVDCVVMKLRRADEDLPDDEPVPFEREGTL
jgi:uncharacterized protein (DUF927 family)